MSLSRDTLKTEEEKKEERMKEDEGKKSLWDGKSIDDLTSA